MLPVVPAKAYDGRRLDAAIDALAQRERFREAESMVAAAAPKLQRVLAQALEDGGWFGDSHETGIRRAVETDALDERLAAVRLLLAEEARMGMMVGVAVGWALADELAAAPNDQREE